MSINSKLLSALQLLSQIWVRHVSLLIVSDLLSMGQLLSQSGPGDAVWAPVFIRDAFVDDSTLSSFLNKLNEVTPNDSNDEVSWDLNSKGVFTVKSYYLKLLSYFSFAIQASCVG